MFSCSAVRLSCWHALNSHYACKFWPSCVHAEKFFPPIPPLSSWAYGHAHCLVGAHSHLNVARCHRQLLAPCFACQIMLPTWCPHLRARSFYSPLPAQSADDTLATARSLYTPGRKPSPAVRTVATTLPPVAKRRRASVNVPCSACVCSLSCQCNLNFNSQPCLF